MSKEQESDEENKIEKKEYLISIHNNKSNQIHYIQQTIRLTRAFSIFYYNKALYWKRSYWITNFVNIGLTSLNTIITVFFDLCDQNQYSAKTNIVLGAVIMASISGITFLNSAIRQKEYEEAGDKYNEVSNNLYTEVFCGKDKPIDLDLDVIIEKYRSVIDSYGERFVEPNPKAIDIIMESNEYKFLMNIKTQVSPEAP
jgi:hypothetical protein